MKTNNKILYLSNRHGRLFFSLFLIRDLQRVELYFYLFLDFEEMTLLKIISRDTRVLKLRERKLGLVMGCLVQFQRCNHY